MTVFGPGVTAPTGAQAAAWLSPRLGEFGTVGGLVPSGYERYLRVHPGEEGAPEGDVGVVRDLVAATRGHTATPGSVWYGIWEGHGWESTRTTFGPRGRGPYEWLRTRLVRRRGLRLDEQRRKRVVEGLARIPTFDVPHRRYYLVNGPIDSAPRLDRPDGSGPQVPDLWWPDDHAWMVATDTDLEHLYIGGTGDLVEALLTALAGRSEPVDREAPIS